MLSTEIATTSDSRKIFTAYFQKGDKEYIKLVMVFKALFLGNYYFPLCAITVKC